MKPIKSLIRLIAAGLIASPMLASNLQAQSTTIVWNPAGNPNQPSDNLWTTAANWSPNAVPGTTYKMAFNNAGANVPSIVDTTAGGGQVVIGDGGGPGTIIVTNGGNLTCGDAGLGNLDEFGWTAIGYNNVGNMYIEQGASVTFNYHLWIGLTDVPGTSGNLIMNGGTASVAGAFRVGSANAVANCHVQMNGGTLTLNQWNDGGAITGTSSIDMAGGTIVMNGNHTNSIATFALAGKITAYNGTGTLIYDYDVSIPGKTTLTASNGSGGPPRQHITSIVPSGDGLTLTINYETTATFPYHVDVTTSLNPTSWSLALGSSTVAIGTSTSYIYPIPPGSTTLFFRTSSP